MVHSLPLDRKTEGAPRRRRAYWDAVHQVSDVAEEQPASDHGAQILAELINTLPSDLKQQIRENIAQYLVQEGRVEQLPLLWGEANATPVIPIESPAATTLRPQPGNGRRKLIAFGWYGGKFSHLNWLLPLLPVAHHYCEPFGGSAAALLNREPAPVETYNDIYGEVANFFRVLRDQTDALIKVIALTPFSREEFAAAVTYDGEVLTQLERARLFFVRARQVRTGLAQTASLGRWANCKSTSRAGMAGVVSRWLGSVEALPDIAARLLRVQIENRPAVDVIKLYDAEDTLFYCDPPYPHESRRDSKAYKFEMTEDEHVALAKVLKDVRGKVAISGYRCELMDRLYSDWRCVEAPEKICHSVKTPRTEALWMNYRGDAHAAHP